MASPQQARRPRLAARHDLVVIARYLGFGLVAWLVPERYWLPVSRLLARLVHAIGLVRDRGMRRQIPLVAGNGVRLDPSAAELERTVSRNLLFMQMLKVHHPLGLRQPIALHGQEHIAEGLQNGHGVILWGSWFQPSSLLEPIALARAGFALHQLSRWDHGPSRTYLGQRWLNRIALSAENRFLAERLVIEEGSFSALMTLQARIKKNCVVGVRAIHLGRRQIELPFLHGRIRIAPGPVELAFATGAVLLPMFMVRDADGRHALHIEAPIAVDRSGDRNDAVAKAMTEYVRRLVPYVLKYPGQWAGWNDQVRPAPADDDQGVRMVADSE